MSTIEQNILNSLSPSNVNYTSFDKSSIMLYFFDGSLTLDGVGTEQNLKFSTTDKKHCNSLYPFPNNPDIGGDADVKLIEIYKSIYPTKKLFSRLTEPQLIALGGTLGVSAKVEDRKADTVNALWGKITG